jgi:hypothetical protein
MVRSVRATKPRIAIVTTLPENSNPVNIAINFI